MGQARNKKVYYCVLSLAGVALGVDKLFFGASNPGEAAAASDYAIAPGEWTNEAKEAAPVSFDMPARASDRLELLEAAPSQSVDAFRIEKEWLKPVPKPAGVAESGEPAENSIEAFKKKAKLTGLSGSGESGQAMINGKRVVVGESFEGFKLVTIDPRSREAVFRDVNGNETTIGLAVGTSGNDASKRPR